MATLYTHAAVGLALGRVAVGRRMPFLFWVMAGLLPILPDLDVFSEAPYGTALGHRGVTHSLCFALCVSLPAAALICRWTQTNFGAMVALFFVVTASHGLLDALTTAGEGIPLFWPLIDYRFGPWGPIHVADISDQFPDPWRSRAVRDELLWVWLPMSMLVGLVTAFRRCRCTLQAQQITASANASPSPGETR